jgi:hypothetical protein
VIAITARDVRFHFSSVQNILECRNRGQQNCKTPSYSVNSDTCEINMKINLFGATHAGLPMRGYLFLLIYNISYLSKVPFDVCSALACLTYGKVQEVAEILEIRRQRVVPLDPRLQVSERGFNRIVIWRIGWQESKQNSGFIAELLQT